MAVHLPPADKPALRARGRLTVDGSAPPVEQRRCVEPHRCAGSFSQDLDDLGEVAVDVTGRLRELLRKRVDDLAFVPPGHHRGECLWEREVEQDIALAVGAVDGHLVHHCAEQPGVM